MIFLTKNILLKSNRKESSMEIKIAFSGIGGVGGYYGGRLAHFYRQSENIKIYFISRGENLEVISREGLKIQTLHEEIIVHPTLATHSPKDIGPVDYLFCTTKSYDLAGNLEEVRPLYRAVDRYYSFIKRSEYYGRNPAASPGTPGLVRLCVYRSPAFGSGNSQ